MTTLLTKLRSEVFEIDSTENTLYAWVKAIRENDEQVSPGFMNRMQDILLNDTNDNNDVHYMTRHRNVVRRLEQLLDDNTNSIQICEDCSSWDYEDEIVYTYDDNPVCSSCRDNYRYSESRDTYVSEDDYYEDEEENESERDEYIYEYDEDVMEHCNFTSSDKDRVEVNPLYMGIELEVERRNNCPYEIGEMTTDNFYNKGKQFAIMKSDGSLTNGFEIVTCPATLNAHRENWDKFFKGEAIKHLKSWNTDTTGMHIHISRNHLSQLDIGKLLVFINDNKNEDFVNHIAGRNSDQWAKKSNKKISDALLSSEKYEAVNMSHRNTIEFRIFKGNLAKQGMFRVMEFVHALVGFSKTTSMTKLSYKDFIKYMELPQNRSEYKIFYGWLTRKSYCIGKPSRSVDWSDTQNNLKEIA